MQPHKLNLLLSHGVLCILLHNTVAFVDSWQFATKRIRTLRRRMWNEQQRFLLLLLFCVLGFVCGINLAIVQSLPVYVSEEWVRFNLFSVIILSKSSRLVAVKQLQERETGVRFDFLVKSSTYFQDNVFEFFTHVDLMLLGVGEDDSARPDQYAQLVMTLVEEGWSTSRHLVQENAKGPPVDAKGVAPHVEDLGCKVLCRATKRIGLVFWLEELGEAEVGQTDIAIVVHQDVLRFQVTMNDASLMKVAESQDNLSANKLDGRLAEAAHFVNVVVNVAAW